MQVYDDGSTAPGWGGKTFISKYRKRGFDLRRALTMFERKQTPHALVMRSVSMICIDIDGKNGGIESAAALNLPRTMAETSKSGNGYHLFYLVDDTWNPTFGFDRLRDRIGWRTGIDIRAVGCVYHYPLQRWNALIPAPLPDAILIDLEQTRDDQVARTEHITKLDGPIAAGKRNNTLFAIGAEMKVAGITGWSEQVYNRAVQLGLDDAEAAKLVSNIDKYGV